ncbi:radical SAM/SPASM domain-containing protein [Rhodopseudomonas pseudopalustris]|uniref:Radical SAM n=2 Tax=Rhodopseudomonas TaxID=1073 RepID=Q130F0_RHOPS|nr:radical SAM protein [Rhodopseudomonas pseudopalustris]ABE41539.1 Radical SAM [Rhodopseudomonas palustris BisB5]SEO10208.1 radical SAM additional 4Fe4S-binding SPASM domain-containing protein [Rhodopseudomonas pseudopalustris]
MDEAGKGFVEFTAPLYVAWELTHRCNAHCVHCYSNSGPDADLGDQLSLQSGLSLIDQLADAGVLVLAFSGGEPMLHRHWRELVAHAVQRGLSVNIASNGSCITDSNADDLRDLGVKSVTISIDSHLPAIHDEFRQLDGLFEKAVKAIHLLVERGVRVVVGFTPTKLNWHDGRAVIDLAHSLGADAVNLSEYVPAGRGTIDLALAPEDLHATLQEWIQAREDYKGRMQIIWHDCRVALLVSEEDQRKYVGCGAGRLVARILPDGAVTPCVFLPTRIGSLASTPFKEMWAESALLRQFRERAGHVGGNCGACEHLATCGGCRSVAYAYSGGDALAGDPHCWILPAEPHLPAKLLEGEGLPV